MVVKYGVADNFDVYGCCPVCDGENEIIQSWYEEHFICEAKTKCKSCGHENYWAYGYFVSDYKTFEQQHQEILVTYTGSKIMIRDDYGNEYKLLTLTYYTTEEILKEIKYGI